MFLLATLAQPQRMAPFSDFRGGRACLDSIVFSTKLEFLGHDCIELETSTILDEKVRYLCDKRGKDFKDEQSCKIHTILSH